MAVEYFNSTGINTYQNPLQLDGNLIHSVNMISFPFGAKSKRPGYKAFLGTPDTNQIQSLHAWNWNDGTTSFLYRASGSSLYYSAQGTGPWTLAQGGTSGDSGGTITLGNHFGAAIGNGGAVFIGGDAVGSTRHTTNGTTFTNTVLAPVSEFFADYQGRMYAAGTSSTDFYSTTNDATNWNLAGTADSSSFTVPGEGRLGRIFVAADRLIETKSLGHLFNWDGASQIDNATNYGPSSPYSVAQIEDYRFWVNQYGHFGFDGANVQLLSNPIERYFYNRQNTGIAPSLFSTIPAECHIYDYFASIGTVTDDFTQRTIPNAVLNYNYQKNEYLMWSLADQPTALKSYYDLNGRRQMIFGDSTGQCFQLDPTATTDNGNIITTELVFLFTYDSQATSYNQSSSSSTSGISYDKKWNWIRLFFNPGCEVNIQAAFANTFTYQHLQWFDIVDNSPNPNQNAQDGICEFRFPSNPQTDRSKLMFLRIYEASPNSQWTYYGSQISADVQVIS